jgi:hypothetical protein
MILKTTKLPLYNNTFYSYSTVLEGNTLTLDFLFLSRLNSWIITLKDSDQNVMLSGERLSPNTALFGDYKLSGLTGSFYFIPNADVNPEDMEDKVKNPKDFYSLYYVYQSGE